MTVTTVCRFSANFRINSILFSRVVGTSPLPEDTLARARPERLRARRLARAPAYRSVLRSRSAASLRNPPEFGGSARGTSRGGGRSPRALTRRCEKTRTRFSPVPWCSPRRSCCAITSRRLKTSSSWVRLRSPDPRARRSVARAEAPRRTAPMKRGFFTRFFPAAVAGPSFEGAAYALFAAGLLGVRPVSYTHLTLPTILLV